MEQSNWKKKKPTSVHLDMADIESINPGPWPQYGEENKTVFLNL